MFVKERFVLDPAIIDKLYSMTPKFGYNGFGELVYYRTYSRKICAKCRTTDLRWDGKTESCVNCGPDFQIGQETWNDTVRRVTEGTFSIRKDWYLKNHIAWDESFWQHYALHFAISMFKMEWLPPGRGLWAMGTQYVYNRGSMSLNNCGFVTLGDKLGVDIAWAMDALMNGVGIGFGLIRNDDLKVYNPTGNFEWVIPDTREGWVYATKLLIDSYFKRSANRVKLIYDEIRGPGLPIRGFGGISSGPEPLRVFHEKIRQFFDMYLSESWYDSILLKADIANCVGQCVVAGNVRRSAEILIGDYEDVADLKNYEKYPYREMHGGLSNNSVGLRTDSDFERLGEIASRVKVNAEPGNLNLRNIPFGRIGKPMGELKYDKASGVNPCQTFTSSILTKNGIRDFGTLKVGDEIWSSEGWTKVIKFWSTGLNPAFRFHTTAGIFEGTANHRVMYDGIKVEVESAPGIDVLRGVYSSPVIIYPQLVVDGLVIGGGSESHGVMCLVIGEDDQDYFESEVNDFIGEEISSKRFYKISSNIRKLPLTFNRKIPKNILQGGRDFVCSFLRGLYSANGCVTADRVQLKATSFDVITGVQLMLSSIGIKSYYTTNKPSMVHWDNGDYVSKQSYDLNISVDRGRFQKIIGFIQAYKNEALSISVKRIKSTIREVTTFDITEIEELGVEETFDITVSNYSHSYWTGGLNVLNCGEQPLEDGELCTISETCPTICQDENVWLKATEYSSMYAATVTLLPTHSERTNAVMLRNRRIGVGIIDVCGWELRIGTTNLIKALRRGYEKVVQTANWANDEAGVPRPVRYTTIKPGGTVPKLPGLRSGFQWPTFGLMVRRIRVAQNHPMYKILHEAELPHEPDIFSVGTEVFEYPIDQGDNGRVKPATEISLWQQAMLLVLLQREWSDNAVSNTLYFRPMWPLVHEHNLHEDIYSPPESILDIIPMSWTDFLEVQEWESDNYRVILKLDKWSNDYLLRVYKFDPNHEEDSVEPVLAAIAPLTKSVSMLPHSAVGVYPQMPEEGISLIEYNNRLAKLKPIDWSKLTGSDGQDEKYCVGPTCEVIR